MSKLDDIVRELNSELGDTNIMTGKTHTKYDFLVARFLEKPADPKSPNAAVFHLTGLAKVDSGKYGKPYCTFTIAEDDSIFSNSSGDFITVYNKLLEKCDGDASALNEMLATTPLKIRTWKKQTKAGGYWTKIVALGFAEPANDDSNIEADMPF